jgi:translation initiation factor IF-2
MIKKEGYQRFSKKDEIPGLFQGHPKQERKLEIILKTDSIGSEEALVSAVRGLHTSDVAIEVIHSDIGHVSKSDLFLAETGSRLVLGFNVDILPKIKELAKEHQVEVRLYSVIYKFVDDLKKIAESLTPIEEKEQVIGRAKVIALFPGGRKGIILGCQVLDGSLALGQKFRLISVPGPVHMGTIDSLHIEKDAVREAAAGQQVGLKIHNFNKARVGDLVESFEVAHPKKPFRWQPRGGVFRY